MAEFPACITDELAKYLKDVLADDVTVVRRPIRVTDPAKTVSVFLRDWHPMQPTAEIGNMMPVICEYVLSIQWMVRAASQEEGLALIGKYTKELRQMLYRDQALRVRLTALTEVSSSSRERLQMFGIRDQKFLNNELRGQFLFLSATTLWVQTENTPS